MPTERVIAGQGFGTSGMVATAVAAPNRFWWDSVHSFTSKYSPNPRLGCSAGPQAARTGIPSAIADF